MTEKEMVDFVVNHAHDTDEAIREQVRKCWELIVVRGRQLEKNAVHVVVPEGGLTPQQMLDVLLAKIPWQRRCLQSKRPYRDAAWPSPRS